MPRPAGGPSGRHIVVIVLVFVFTGWLLTRQLEPASAVLITAALTAISASATRPASLHRVLRQLTALTTRGAPA
ncbi:hypothetical protein [Amycolatopsis thermoflava]|uniref:hypothetical protein n=1 Tax=Amycolatopsis thermoflava TaxID=84480 RepID=UPI003662F2EF